MELPITSGDSHLLQTRKFVRPFRLQPSLGIGFSQTPNDLVNDHDRILHCPQHRLSQGKQRKHPLQRSVAPNEMMNHSGHCVEGREDHQNVG
jgi:hypothetical protein